MSTELTIVPPEVEQPESLQVRGLAEVFQIREDPDASTAQEMLVFVTERQKLLADQLKFETELFKQGIERIAQRIKPDLDNWAAAGAALRLKVAAWSRARQVAQLQAAQAANEAHAAGATPEVVQALVVESATPAPVIAGVGTRAKWKAQVTDLAAFARAALDGKIPLDLLVPDMKALDKLARATKGPSTIPGVVFADEGSVVVRSPQP